MNMFDEFEQAQEGREQTEDGRLRQQSVPRYFLYVMDYWDGYSSRAWEATVLDRSGFILNRFRTAKKSPAQIEVTRCGHHHKTEVAAWSCGRVLFRKTIHA